MDFQEKVLQELLQLEPASRKAMLAQLSAILQCMCIKDSNNKGRLTLHSARPQAWKKCFTLLEKTYNIVAVSALAGSSLWEPENEISGADRTMDFHGEAARRIAALMRPPEHFEQDEKCIRSYLAGEFLCIGCVRNPEKEYYLSFEVEEDHRAELTLDLLARTGLQLRRQEHGRSHAVLTRDSGVIVDVLNVLGAHVSMMDMENARIVRQVRSRINRKVNCETANIMKTVAASQKQLEEIQLLRHSKIWDTIPESLRQMALLREQYPDSSLQELGQRMNPPVGKSGVNHRLRRLSELAQKLQEQESNQA